MTLNDLERRNDRCIALFHLLWYTCVATHNRVDLGWNLCTSLLHFVRRVRCRRKESSRSLSHLLMSFCYLLESTHVLDFKENFHAKGLEWEDGENNEGKKKGRGQ